MQERTLDDTLARTSGPPTVLIVSDSYLGSTLAAEFESRDVRLVTNDSGVAAQAPDHVDTTVGDVTALETLEAAEGADAAIVGLTTDRKTLLVTQLLRTRFDPDATVVVLNNPERHDAMSDVATTVVSGPDCLSTALHRTIQPTPTEATDR